MTPRFIRPLPGALLGLLVAVSAATAQYTEPAKNKVGGSSNVKVLGHVPLGGFFRTMDVEIEEELSRPYAYASQSRDRPGFTILSLADLDNIKPIYHWRIENPELHGGTGGMDGKYFKLKGKYYYVQSLQFGQGGPDSDLGAVVADVTSLPDTSKIRIVARIRDAEHPGGFHNIFAYKHSDGRVLLFTTVGGPFANVYDMEKVLAGDAGALIGRVPIPANQTAGRGGYHDFYVAFDAETQQDKFYGAGRGGYFLYDVTNVGREEPTLLTSIVGASGISSGHTFTPTPDGKFAVTESEYQYAPLRLFDLRPGLSGEVQTISRPISAWTADWRALAHNHEIRWPYVFVSGYEDGLQIFNMMDPENPHTLGWYYTCMCKHQAGFGGVPVWEGTSVMNGAFGVDVRNSDGLVVITDSNTGFWAFRFEGFSGWNGKDWGMPNVSSVQNWDTGPEGVRGKTAAMVN